jgi:DNA replication protein DnaC
MLTHPTLDQLKALNLDGMADAFVELHNRAQAAELSHAEWLALLLDREAANRNTRRFQIRLRGAKLRHSQAAIEDVDYRTPRRLDKALFQQLTAGKWIAEHRNLLVTGPCGIGKSWLACALAQKACRDGYTVVYQRLYNVAKSHFRRSVMIWSPQERGPGRRPRCDRRRFRSGARECG